MPQTAQDQICVQHAEISQAIYTLSAQLKELENVAIDNASWVDVSRFAAIAEAAKRINQDAQEGVLV